MTAYSGGGRGPRGVFARWLANKLAFPLGYSSVRFWVTCGLQNQELSWSSCLIGKKRPYMLPAELEGQLA